MPGWRESIPTNARIIHPASGWRFSNFGRPEVGRSSGPRTPFNSPTPLSPVGCAGGPPKYLISDKGGQFWCKEFKDWCRPRQIKPRFGAVGKHGSIAVIERFIGTLKREGTRRFLIPLRSAAFREELKLICDWYNEDRPHQALKGGTPNEVYHGRCPANRKPRCESREGWPRGSRCAAPQTLVAGQPGDEFAITVDFVAGRKHLPVVGLKRAA